MKKHPFSISLASALLAVTTAACGGAAAGGTAASVQGVSKTAIDLGTILPLTGDAALAAQGVQAGLQAEIGVVNADGGINGRKINLTVLDDHFSAATHVADFKRLVNQDKVYAVLVSAGSANIPGDWPTAKETGALVFGPYLPVDPGLQSVFSLGTDHPHQAQVLASYLSQRGVKTIGFIGQQNDLGTSMYNALKAIPASLHLTIEPPEWVQPNSTSVTSAVLDARKDNPGAVILGTDGSQSALILKQAAQLNWKAIFAGDSSTASTNSNVVTAVASPAANGLLGSYFAVSPTSNGPAVQKFRAAVSKYAANGSKFVNNSFALQSYAFAEVFFHILKGLGNSLSWSSFEAAAQGLKDYQTGILAPVTFGPLPDGHVGTTEAKIAEFEHGNWVTVTPNWISPAK